MIRYILRRIILAIPVLFLSSVLVFSVIHLIPGDPAEILGGPNATPEALDAIRGRMGLNRPLPVQYVLWLNEILHGDFGNSTLTGQPIGKLLLARAPATLELTLAALFLSLLVSIPLGIVTATRTRGTFEWVISTAQSLAIAVPSFWVGILLIYVFAVFLGWLPPGGRVADVRDVSASIKSLVLPAATLAVGLIATQSRFIKFNVLEVLYEDYVRSARAKGLHENAVLYRHVLRNAMLPLITILGLQFGALLGGQVVIESVFSWPGLGELMISGISNRDYALVQAGLLCLVTMYLALNLLVDLSYAVIDPRIRHSAGG